MQITLIINLHFVVRIMYNKTIIDFNKCLKQETKYFTFYLKLSFNCYHKQIKTLTFTSVYNYKTKYN